MLQGPQVVGLDMTEGWMEGENQDCCCPPGDRRIREMGGRGAQETFLGRNAVSGQLRAKRPRQKGTTFSLMNCQMMRVISSPSISTTGLATLILLSASRTGHRLHVTPLGRLVGESLSSPPDLPFTVKGTVVS